MGFQLHQRRPPPLAPRGGERQARNQSPRGTDPGKESKQTPAGRGRNLTGRGRRRSPRRAPGTREPRGQRAPRGRPSVPPRTSPAAHRAPASLATWTRQAPVGSPGPIAPEKDGAPWGLNPSPRQARPPSLSSAARRIPDFGPRPASAARPPRPAPGPRWRQRSVTAPLLSLLRSAPCQQEEALLHPKGPEPRPSAGGARVRGHPRRRRGRRGGGRWPGPCVGGEGRGGEPHRGSRRLLPAPASTFCTAQSGTCPQPLGSGHGLCGEGTRRGVGGRLPGAAGSSRRRSKLSGAASPTAIFPGKRPRRRLRRRFPHLLSLLRDAPLPPAPAAPLASHPVPHLQSF